jgi:hypothetical protein
MAFTHMTGGAVMYSLWHIPSSTLLIVSSRRDDVEQYVDGALCDGLPIEDMMLQVAQDDELLGQQYLGPCITDLLRKDDDPDEIHA